MTPSTAFVLHSSPVRRLHTVYSATAPHNGHAPLASCYALKSLRRTVVTDNLPHTLSHCTTLLYFMIRESAALVMHRRLPDIASPRRDKTTPASPGRPSLPSPLRHNIVGSPARDPHSLEAGASSSSRLSPTTSRAHRPGSDDSGTHRRTPPRHSPMSSPLSSPAASPSVMHRDSPRCLRPGRGVTGASRVGGLTAAVVHGRTESPKISKRLAPIKHSTAGSAGNSTVSHHVGSPPLRNKHFRSVHATHRRSNSAGGAPTSISQEEFMRDVVQKQRAHLGAPEMPGGDEAGPAVVTSSPTTTELRRGPRPPQKVCL
jgi:hypothetical protein